MKNLHLIGSAFGHGAQNHDTEKGPLFLRDTFKLQEKLECVWKDMIHTPGEITLDENGYNFSSVLRHTRVLYDSVVHHMKDLEGFLTVIGGDHSCAVGTWSGVIDSLEAREEFGLIWFDAHEDAHTPESSPSKAYHGMPLAHLLGAGHSDLCTLGGRAPKIKPENLVLVGVRSYEAEERAFLEQRNVKVFYMDDLKKSDLKTVMRQALEIATTGTKGFGISLDVDMFDPKDAPGAGSLEPDGVRFENFKEVMAPCFGHPQLKAIEIAEFNPCVDHNDQTATLIQDILQEVKNTQTQTEEEVEVRAFKRA